MTHRYRAPEHTSAISAPTRDIPVGDDGLIELPDDAPLVEHEYLRRAGCVPVADEPAAAKPKAAKPEAPADPEAESAAEPDA